MSEIYGTVRPAAVKAEDVEIFYNFSPTRYQSDSDSSQFTKISSELLRETTCSGTSIPGLYNLALPLNLFGNKGFYSVYIRPTEEHLAIADVGYLYQYPNIRGIVFKASDIPGYTTSNALAGYRVEYFENGKRLDYSRLITSSLLCNGVAQSTTNGSEATIAYSPSDLGNMVFCTLTPSSSASFKATAAPNIGVANQEVAIINTKFNPVLLEIEMVNHDAETLSYMLEGEQVHDIDKGIITTFNFDREPYTQISYKSMKNTLGNSAYTVKTRRETLEPNQDINSILGDTLVTE